VSHTLYDLYKMDSRQIKKTDETKYNPEKANNAKYSTTKLPWFSGLLPHSARKRGGLILQLPSPYGAHDLQFDVRHFHRPTQTFNNNQSRPLSRHLDRRDFKMTLSVLINIQ